MPSRIILLILVCSLPVAGNAQNSLFKKYSANPVIDIGPSVPAWRGIHVANAAILTPAETSDHTWRIYIRGSGNTPEYHDQIGILYQDSAGFSPYGPWLEYEHNPVLKYGSPGSYDEKNLLDCAPLVGENGTVYFYYKAVRYDGSHSVAGAVSDDGGYSFQKFPENPLQEQAGINDAIYHNGEYFIYYGKMSQDATGRWILQTYLKRTPDPTSIRNRDSTLALPAGGGPGNFDYTSVHGTRIFRLGDRWYMVYQGSNIHIDFPHRFHAAYSDDLINWTKVDNDFPLLERGSYGDWDQGGIWYGEVFEHRDTLYMLYEGWGCYCIPENRNRPYFPGNSRTGMARVSVDDFLLWAGGGLDSTWVSDEIAPGDTIADFEEHSPDFHTTYDMPFEMVDNPAPDEVNPSPRVGKITTTADMWESLQTEPFDTRFDFSGGSRFTMKVYSETGGDLYFRLAHPSLSDLEIQIRKTVTTTRQWVDLEFDFSTYMPWSDLYGKILLFFDGGGTEAGNTWYFDDIVFNPAQTSVAPSARRPVNHNSLQLFYDPHQRQVRILNLPGRPEYEVYNLHGQKVKAGTGNTIPVGDLEQGVYIIRSGRLAAKFIRE